MPLIFRANIREIEHLAGRIMHSMQLDPVSIAIIVQAIIAALRLWNDCRNHKRRWRRRVAMTAGQQSLRTAVVAAIGEAGLTRLRGDEFLDQLVSQGQQHRDSEIEALYLL